MIPQADLVVRPKKMIEDTVKFTVPVSLRPNTIFGDELCTWRELISTPGILPDDIVAGIYWDYEDEDDSDSEILKLFVNRLREETDEEYLTRVKNEDELKARMQQLEEEHDLYEYERLKAKYDGNGKTS